MNELENVLKEGNFIIGRDRTLKMLKNEKLKKVFLASNCDEETKNQIKKYAKLGNVEVIELDINNQQLGVKCKKLFAISVLGF